MKIVKREYNKTMEKSRAFYSATITYFIIFALFILIRMLSSFGLLSLGKNGDYLFTFIVQIVLLLGGALLVYPALRKKKSGQVVREFGVKRTSGKVIFLSILLGFVVFFLNGYVSNFFNSAIELFGYEHSYGTAITSYSFGNLILNIIFTALLPAICEEIAHRGMLLKSFSPLGAWKAILISSLLFGLLHLNIEQFFYATIIGIFLGILTTLTNSIIPAIIVHFMNNALSTYRSFSIVNGLPFGKAVLWVETVISSNIFLSLVLGALILVVLAYFAYKLTVAITKLRAREDLELMQNWFTKQLVREEYLANLEDAIIDATGEGLQNPQLERLKQFALFEDEADAATKFKPPAMAKVLMYVTLFMGSVLTIFTFVWGAL